MPLKDYPDEILVLYYEGMVMADYLKRRADGGPRKLMNFAARMKALAGFEANISLPEWNNLLLEYYQIPNAEAFQAEVTKWFLAGSPNNFKGDSSTSSGSRIAQMYLGPSIANGQQLVLFAANSQKNLEYCRVTGASNCKGQSVVSLKTPTQFSQGNFIYQDELDRPLQAGETLILQEAGFPAQKTTFQINATRS